MNHGNIESVIGVLRKHGVPFVVIGGVAVNAQGYIRATVDVDIVFIRDNDSEKALAAAFKEMEAVYLLNEKNPLTGMELERPANEAFIRVERLMMVDTKFGPLDVFDHVPSCAELTPNQLYDAAEEVDGVRYASRRHLTEMKLRAARGKDLVDIQEIGEFANPGEALIAAILNTDEKAALDVIQASNDPSSVLYEAISLLSILPEGKRAFAKTILLDIAKQVDMQKYGSAPAVEPKHPQGPSHRMR